MTPSIRQQVIYDTFTSTDENILVQAVAGGSKTTVLMGIVARAKFRTLFLAFNKSIQQEIEEKITSNGYEHAKSMTLHSLGLSAIKYKYGYRNVIINNNKIWGLIKYLEKLNPKIYSKIQWEEKSKINMTLIEMNDVSRLFLTDDKKEIFSYMKDMDKYFYDEEVIEDLWKEFIIIRDQCYSGNSIEIDYTDMIYLVVKYNLLIPIQPYYLLIDEAQDLNLAQHKFIDQLINQGDIKKWVAVGDRRQSIYGFSGAYGASFDLFKEKENVIELPLDVCYRCPKLIIDEANEVYNVMEGYKDEDGIVEEVDDVWLIKNGSMVICRNTGPLIDLFFSLLGQQRKVYIKGDDILASTLKFLKPYTYKTVAYVREKVRKEIDYLAKKEKKKDDEWFKYHRLKEQFGNFELLVMNLQCGGETIEVLLQLINDIFKEGDDADAVTLCTIHKSKGLEADVVYILNEFLIPSKFAKSPMQLEQERNLKYVARTRAKKELYYLNIKQDEEF